MFQQKHCVHESKVEVLKVLMSIVTVVMSGCGLSEHSKMQRKNEEVR